MINDDEYLKWKRRFRERGIRKRRANRKTENERERRIKIKAELNELKAKEGSHTTMR